MKLYLVRHGEAISPELDPEKPLSPRGREEIQKIARFLAVKSFPVSKIIHSEKARARQTAEIFKQYLAPNSVLEEYEQLGPNDSIDEIADHIQEEDEDVMIVGHLPFLQKILGFLVTGHEEHVLVNFQAGTVVCLEKDTRFYVIDWIISIDRL